jgi:hypothetical protein
LNSAEQNEGHKQYWCSFSSCSWVDGWVGGWMGGCIGGSKSRFKDCLQQSKILFEM